MLSPAEHLYYFTRHTLQQFLKTQGFTAVHFPQAYAGFGVFETMNPRNTHAPQSWRALLYSMFVARLGPLCFKQIQAWGRQDTLLCFAQVA